MRHYFFILLISFWATTCTAHDEHYYSLHPKLLQKAIETCPQKQPKDLSCQQLAHIASNLNNSAYELRASPQDYGKKILALQEVIAKQESVIKSSIQPELKKSLEENKRHLQERLAVVKWLESPEG